MLVPLKILSNVSRFKPALNLNRVLADLNRGSNSLNSISAEILLFSIEVCRQNNLRNYDTENDENCQNFTLFNSNWKGYEIFLIVTKIKHWFCCDVPFF